MKKILLLLLTIISFFFASFSFAANPWTIIPSGGGDGTTIGENEQGETDFINSVEKVSKEPGKVWENYNKESKKGSSNSAFAFKTGIFSWDAVFDFFKHLARFLSQIGLVIGAFMIIYSGYKYASGVFTGDASKGGKDALKGAIYGILILIFSYAFMKILLSMFW